MQIIQGVDDADRERPKRISGDLLFSKLELLTQGLPLIVQTPRTEKPQVQNGGERGSIESEGPERPPDAVGSAARRAQADGPHHHDGRQRQQHNRIEPRERRAVAQRGQSRLDHRVQAARVHALDDVPRQRSDGQSRRQDNQCKL
jgi:hypothetical protein